MIIVTFPFHWTVGVTIGIVTKHQAMFDESKLSSSFLCSPTCQETSTKCFMNIRVQFIDPHKIVRYCGNQTNDV
jgi:hypothetical protein